MPRKKQYSRDNLVAQAMQYFWHFGYQYTSMSDLVVATGVNRHGIYAEFEGKRTLFLACLEKYQDSVVSPAFERVEARGANLASIAEYFEFQIARAEQSGLPGPGCLVANTMTECGPHDSQIEAAVRFHNDRLQAGFLNALRNEFGMQPKVRELKKLATFLNISAQGLWSVSRSVTRPRILKDYAKTLIELTRMRMEH